MKVINESLPTLAFSHLMYHSVGLFELQMALMYRPRNSHCIYVDRKANKKVIQAVTSIVQCYREEFLSVS
jgi:hypothetical protein